MKNGGTMQEHQENYNDYKVSAPKDFKGNGYSNVGRNYSPAWGGQFQMGGNVYPVNYVPQAQDGKKLNPFTYPKPDYSYSTNPFLVRDPQFGIFIGGVNPTYSTKDFSVGASMVGVGNKDFQKLPADYGIRGSYNPTDSLSINANLSKDNFGAGLSYRFQEGGSMFKKPSILQQEYIDPIYSYPERDLYPSEDEFLKENTHVGGMAAEDDHVIINPYSPLPKEMKDLVRINETARLAMRNGYPRPTFDLTPKQKEFYSTIQNGKPYSEDLQDIKETIAARIMTGDDSAQDYTKEQEMYADKLFDVLKKSKEYATGMKGMMKSKIGMAKAFEQDPKFDSSEESEYFSKNYKDLNSFQAGGSIPGSVGFTYARTKGIPSNGPYAKKTMASAQDGSQVTENNDWLANWYANRKIPNEQLQSLYEEDKPYYLERLKNIPEVTNVDLIGDDPNITGSYKTDTNQILVTPQARDNVYLHEANHYLNNFPSAMRTVHGNITSANIAPKENLTGVYKDKYDYFSNPDEVHSRIQVLRKKAKLKPDEEVTPERLNKFLKTYEGDDENINDLLNLSDTDHLLEMLNYMAYNEPSDMSSIAQNGKEMSYYQHGLDWKPKGMKNGGWLDAYDKAQEGERVLPNNNNNKALQILANIQKRKQKGMPSPNFSNANITDERGEAVKKVDNTSTITPKEQKRVTPSKVRNQIQEELKFMKGWTNSPMYNQMLNNSTKGVKDEQDIKNIRKERLNNLSIEVSDTPYFFNKNTGGESRVSTGNITFYPIAYSDSDIFKGTPSHEISHSQDSMRNPFRNLSNDLFGTNFRTSYIPQSDVNMMNKYSKGILYNTLFNDDKYKDDDTYDKTRDFYEYVTEPTETRARLNALRYIAKENNIYDPYTQKINMDQLEKLRQRAQKLAKEKGFDPYMQLHDYGGYNDEEILNMLNTISKNEDRNQNPNIATAKDGRVIKDDRGQWEHPGEITEINSPYITMQGVPYPVLGISDTGDTQMMYPEEEYEFDGEKVTEYPMAQRGVKLDFSKGRIGKIQKFIEEAKNKKNNNKINIKEQNTTVADKTSVKQNKQKKIVDVPLTEKEMVNNSINNQARFMKDWMNSPMYDEMLDNSTTGYFDKRYLTSGRNSNFNDIKVQLHPQPEDSPNTGASSNSETGLIKLFPLGAKGQALEGMLAHEISHSSDKPRFLNTNSSSKFIPRNKYNNKGIEEEVRLIPEKDINLMKSFYSDNNVYKNLFNKSALKNKDLNEQREWFNYVSEPTETRARLNDIRYNAKKYGIYDPFTQKVTPEILNEIKELTKKAGGFDPFYQLQGVYSDEEILKLLNTVSQNEQPDENPYIATAKNGLRQEQKGLVNLDNLINFTNYNKPESNGWLDKYEDGGTVPPVISKQVNLKQEIPFEKIPTTDNKKIVIDNFSPSYDYIVEGDKTYYKVKGGNSWADISNNTKARKNLLEFLDKNNYWAGYGSGEKAKYDKVKNQPVIVPGGKIPKTTPTIIRNTETGNKPMIVKRPIKKVIEEEPGFFDDVSDFVSSGVDSLEKKWKDVKKEAKHVVKTVGDAVSSGIDNAITTTEDAYHTVMNGIQRKYQTHTGDDDDAEVKTSVNENPKTVKEWYGNKSGAEITQVLDAPNVPGRTYKQQVLPTSNIRFGVRNRGEYKDIKTDGLEVTTFQPFTKNALPDDASVLAIDANGNLHTGQYKEFKGKKDYMFSRTFRNKIIDFPEINGKGEYVSGAKSGNPRYQQPKVKVLDDNGKVVNGSLNILVKDDSKKDYYGQVQGGRILFVNPTTKEQYLVSGSISHIKQKFKELKGNNKYLEAYTLDNGTYSRGLSYKDKKLTKDRLKSYDLENTSGGNGLYIIDYKQPVSKYSEDYIDNMPNVRTKNDESYKKGHPLKNEIKNIVLHHTAYTGPNAEKELNKQYMTPGQNSSHIVIQENGKRSIYASPEQVTFHAGESEWNKRKDVNDFSIGVEFQGDTNKKPLTQAQIESFVEYYEPLAKKYNLSLKDIITHQMIAPGRKPDISEKQYARILKYMRDRNFK
jgi:hypothetical protein